MLRCDTNNFSPFPFCVLYLCHVWYEGLLNEIKMVFLSEAHDFKLFKLKPLNRISSGKPNAYIYTIYLDIYLIFLPLLKYFYILHLIPL